ncbi:hypothetical protein AVEN_110081-1 [Araneus ventricosus]|uniref:Uncharacterized protein n=1 Tax=Araneus ventricosus TaxID=182803 RepID=A0A4Y2SYQ1_ARAVE|nr:hypothetical protein AVEN_110081-1 [Araneus ventricosus]
MNDEYFWVGWWNRSLPSPPSSPGVFPPEMQGFGLADGMVGFSSLLMGVYSENANLVPTFRRHGSSSNDYSGSKLGGMAVMQALE